MLPNPSQEDINKSGQKPVPYDPTIPEATLVYHDYYAAKQNIEKLKTLKQNDPNKKVVISIGGWTLSWTLSKIAADPILRKRLIDSSVEFVVKHGFDGIDIDWEFVGKQGIGYNYVDEVNDGPNFVQMLKEMREALDIASPNKHLEITAATGCNPIVLNNYKGTEPYMDYLLLMSYDFSGGWDSYGGHLSPLYHNPDSKSPAENNCNTAVKNAMKAGYPSNKICLGCPFYGRGWEQLEGNYIFGKSLKGSAVSVSKIGVGEPGMSSWVDIRNKINDGTYTAYEDSIAKAAYCIDANGKTWSYDSPQTAKYKAQYVLDNNLGGMLLWELSDDTRDGKENLLDAINEVLNNKPVVEPVPETVVEPVPETVVEPVPETVVEPESSNDLVIKPGQTIQVKYQIN
jgi:chitinase